MGLLGIVYDNSDWCMILFLALRSTLGTLSRLTHRHSLQTTGYLLLINEMIHQTCMTLKHERRSVLLTLYHARFKCTMQVHEILHLSNWIAAITPHLSFRFSSLAFDSSRQSNAGMVGFSPLRYIAGSLAMFPRIGPLFRSFLYSETALCFHGA